MHVFTKKQHKNDADSHFYIAFYWSGNAAYQIRRKRSVKNQLSPQNRICAAAQCLIYDRSDRFE